MCHLVLAKFDNKHACYPSNSERDLCDSFSCLLQTKQCTSCASHTRLNPDGSYGPFSAPMSRTEFVGEGILRTVMSYKAMRLAISQTVVGDLHRCFDDARKNPISSSGVYYPMHHYGWAASLRAALERAVMVGDRNIRYILLGIERIKSSVVYLGICAPSEHSVHSGQVKSTIGRTTSSHLCSSPHS